MIDAKELRIGNYLSGNNDPEMQVFSINPINGVEMGFIGMQEDESIDYGLWYYNLSELKPIPLTEEWLLKFGCRKLTAEKHICYCIEINEQISIYISIDKLVLVEVGIGEDDNEYLSIIDYVQMVHQLQNLYFSLSGKELEFKN